MKKQVIDQQVDFSETTGCLARHALMHSMSAAIEAVEKLDLPESALVPLSIAQMVAACAGPLFVLAGTIAQATLDHAATLSHEEKKQTDPLRAMNGGVTPDSMLLASLLVHRGLQIKGPQYEFDFGPQQIADAMRDFAKLTGRDCANFMRNDMVEQAVFAETEGKAESEELLRLLRSKPDGATN